MINWLIDNVAITLAAALLVAFNLAVSMMSMAAVWAWIATERFS